jgi:hypothetical protein
MAAVLTGGGTNYGDILTTPYGLKELPPELALKEQANNRRQQIANLMLQQATQLPQGRMAGKFYVAPSWAQNAAQLAEGLGGAIATAFNAKERNQISKDSQDMLADAVSKYQGATAPTISEGPRPTAQVTPPAPQGGPYAGIMPQPTAQPVTTELPGPGAPVRTPATPEARQQALVQLLASQHPQAQALGKLLSQQQFMEEQRGEDRALRREGIDSNAELRKGQIEANMLNTQAMIDSRERQGMDANSLKKTLADQQAELKKMEIASREKIAEIAAGSREKVADKRSGENRPMTATEQKELIQTEEEMQGSHQAIKNLQSALAINDKALGFSGAGVVAQAGSLIPESMRPKSIDATVELDNLITGSALPQLKAIFGGMPTEGERKVLLDVQGSSGKTPAQRKLIFERAIEAANNRIKFGQQKADQLRQRTYFSGSGGVDTTVQNGPASSPSAPTGTVRKYNPATGKIE